MKARFVILLCLNAVVLSVGAFLISRHWRDKAAHEQEAAQSELDMWKEKASARSPAVRPIVVQTNAFKWSQVESTDYRQYIANLRAIGCPEMTIKDLIMTDVMRLFAQRRGQYYQNGRPFKFWETDEKQQLKENQVEERDRALAQIDKDLPAVLRELLGVNYQRELDKYFVDTDEDGRRLAFLSGDKRDKLLALREKFEGRREAISYALTNGTYSTEDIQKLRLIDEEQNAALADILTPQEREEYELSTSPTADHLRKELVGFNPTEAEFRNLFQRQQAIDATYAYMDMNDPAVRNAKAADEQTMMSEVKMQLPAERATALDRSHDPDYQNLSMLAERFDLPPETSQTIADMRQAAEDEKQQLIANKDIPTDRLEVALKAIQAETEKAAKETLGDKAFAQYDNGSNWIQRLGGN